ncbi:LysR family transcriptional regulator [Pseudomonas sp. WS 5106]|jgi:DNA-binding transcriptional LysR family regulator|uniref:LysR family transcriptional regulator n=1 Tax=Pseudomonas cremoris TaxID=2724178 RepID=A0A7X1ASC4_9PSED|nr:LysR family transcriptional regulator [Pseudomonas cremoris]MBC2383283.1 LysR family transcriptional regulator [Pseudomonas cremoris]MBC2409527.1 LysR family transcriptional regulator [Pseudomonas cremoris]
MPDLNLLITLDVLLTEGSVARAAQRLRLSPSAMSRALARLRETTGDPLLVRAGRGLVPTPRAMELREQVSRLVQEAHAVLRPTQTVDMAQVVRTFTLRASEEFVENFGPALLARIARDAPGVRLRFVNKTDKDSAPLREGSVDLDTGVVDADASPELLTQALFRDRLIGVVRAGHSLSRGEVSAERYAQGQHVYVSRRGQDRGQIDDALEAQGLTRQISTIVAGFSTAIALARDTDLIASVPERYTAHQREGLHSFALPLTLPAFTVAMLWHPRLDADLAHRWLRGCLREVCGPQQVQSPLP